MLNRWRNLSERLRSLIIGISTVLVFAAGKTWPNYSFTLWSIFAVLIAVVFYAEVSEPVNYDFIRFLDGAIEYGAAGQKHLIRFDEIARLEYVREHEIYVSGIESKWMVYFHDGSRREVLDEWADGRRLRRVFEKHLPGFDKKAARRGRRAWREGKWLCYTAVPR